MALHEPVAAYNAATNFEAELVKARLIEAGVEAFAVEDLSPAGLWMFGTLPEIHKPQVWVNKSDLDQARRVLQEYASELAQANRASQPADSDLGAEIEVVCEDCRKVSLFPSSQGGTVQFCPACGANVDVGDIDDTDAFWLQHDEPQD